MRVVAVAAVVGLACAPASAAPQPRPLRYACASELYGAQGVLKYVADPSRCSGGLLIDLGAGPTVLACEKQPGTPRGASGKRGIRKRAPAGLMRLAEDPLRCPGVYWQEAPVTLPARKRLPFCAAKKGGELRLVRSVKRCDRKEIALRLAKRLPASVAPAPNAAPVAADDSGSTDATHAVSIAVLANDSDPDGNPLRVGTLDSTGTTGEARLNGDGTVTYSPGGRFRSLGPGQTATDSFKYTATDGAAGSAPATVTVTIGGSNDAPVAFDDSGATDEDTPTTIALSGNDKDPDGDAVTVGALDLAGTKGTVAVAPGGSAILYSPNSQFEGLAPGQQATDTFRYRASDGSAESSQVATVTVTVAGRNDAPGLTTSTAGPTTAEDGSAVVDGGLAAGDPDNSNLASATIKVTNGFQAGDHLDFADQNGIDGEYDAMTGELKLTGSAPVATYAAALQTIEFGTTNDVPEPAKTIEATVSDGSADSAAVTWAATVSGVNDAPTVDTSSGSASFTTGDPPVPVDPAIDLTDPDSEISGATVKITTGYTAADGDALVFTPQGDITGTYEPLTQTLTLTGTASVADYEAALQSVAYTNVALAPATDARTISFEVTDADGAGSNSDTRDVTVSGPPPPPGP